MFKLEILLCGEIVEIADLLRSKHYSNVIPTTSCDFASNFIQQLALETSFNHLRHVCCFKCNKWTLVH